MGITRDGISSVSMTDRELRAFHRREEWIFRRIVEEQSPRLLSYLKSYAEDLAGAEDLAQSVWARAFERAPSLRSGSSLTGWLLTIARTVAVEEYRRTARIRRRTGVVGREMAHSGSTGVTPLDPAERAERAERVRVAVMELPPRQRETVMLRMLEGKTTAETAVAMDCAEGTVKAALHKALATLARELRDLDESEEIDEIA